jgi:type III secretion protein E
MEIKPMTRLEEQLHNVEAVRSIRVQLEMALGGVKRCMLRGGTPEQFQCWQKEVTALESGLTIINTLTGENNGY